ncbi:hypothetical protein FRC07_002015 [Ceratobasidium sp. 392]|nr:hypothetical protein FRC07_002015 [Ceratobasidium sp. 392]
MYISHSCRIRPGVLKNTVKITRYLTGSTNHSPSNEGTRRAPLAKDLGGISLDNAKNTDNKTKGYVPRMKDLGHSPEHVNQLLSVRLNRRLPPVLRTGPGPNRRPPGSEQRRNPSDRRPQQQQQPRTFDGGAPRASFSRPRNTSPGTRTAGAGRKGGTSGPRGPRRTSRSITPRSRDVVEEPEIPVPPAPIPSKVYDLTSLPTLTSPTRSLTPTSGGEQPSDVVQRVREVIGGDYSRWMTKEDLAAAGKDDVSSIARARLALAFNSSVSPKDRKKLLDTTEMLLNRGKTVSVPAPSK